MVRFDKEKYTKIAEDFELWWEHKLKRPIIQVTLTNTSTALNGDFFGTNYRKEILEAYYDLTLSAEETVKKMDEAYDCVEFYGDAFPVFYMRPTGVMGAYLGQKYDLNKELGTVWFSNDEMSLEEIAETEVNKELPLYKRSIELTKEVQKYFDGKMGIGVPDFGGVYDILASMHDSNELLVDLCVEEDEVKKAAWKIHEQFKILCDEFFGVIDKDKIPGYSCWATMLSQKPYFVLQNDFSAMISPQMYDDFYLPILREECKYIPRTIYHLDGPDAVRHLDSVLTVEELDGVQWVNGAGAAGLDKWPDIYKKILGAGKLCQVFINDVTELHYIDDIVNIVGTTEGLCFICTGDSRDKEQFDAYLKKYGVI